MHQTDAQNRASLLSDVEEVRVSNDSHMNGRTDKLILTTNSILGSVRCFADWSGIVSLKAWPSEVRSCAVNLGQGKKARGWRPGEGVGKRLEMSERRPVEKQSGLQAFLCDYTSVEKEARHSFSHVWSCWLLPLITSLLFFLISKKRNSAVNVLFGDCRLRFLIQKHGAVWISPFKLLCLD